MEKNSGIHLQDIIYGSADPVESARISKLQNQRKIKKIAPRLYTGKLHEPAEVLIRRHIYEILGRQYPDAVLSHRSALEYKPTDNGSLFLTYSYTKKIILPGITIRFLEGPGPMAGDSKFIGELYVSQPARAYLENLQVSRRPGADSKTLSIEQIEGKLERMMQANGEFSLNQLRDQARELAPRLGMQQEFDKLNKIIGALLKTRSSSILRSDRAKARAEGYPYDSNRLTLFEKLFVELKQREFTIRPDLNDSHKAFSNFAFFESYFSNYIEGTIFAVEEAIEIIETQKPLPARDEDSHDVLGTYQLVSNPQEMKIIPESGEHLLEIIRYRHQLLLSARPSKQPGSFRNKPVFAGNTSFVEPELLVGTLLKGYEYYRMLDQPFARAIFMMFLISEVHPFLDGNGRMARVMMNADLVYAGSSKIIIPTVYRDDYIGALRKLTRQEDPKTYIRMMERAYEFSANVYDEDRNDMRSYLESCNAFWDDTEGKVLKIVERRD